MNVILGYWLDSGSYPDALGGQEAVIGTVVTGFNGLIGILETQIGLSTPKTSEVLRIAQWQELVRNFDSGNMPFSKSFETDPWNTARELLRRRDELVIAGWDPNIHVGGSSWLETLAQLEQANKNRTPGFSDRVRVLLARLQQHVQLDIDSITIVDEDETLWDPWSLDLLHLLAQNGVKIAKKPLSTEKENQAGTDLALLLKVLDGEIPFEEAQGDGSLLLIRSETEWDAADYLISWLQENDSDDTVLIRGEGSLFLDEMLHRRGVAALGVEAASKWRAVLQVLPLTIDTYWKPLRVDRMLELLTIPTSPVPSRIRYKLANVLSNAPGIGGPLWLNAIDEGFRDYEESWIEEGLDEIDRKKKRKRILDSVNLWVNHDYYDPNEGIPFDILVSICQKVSKWAAGKLQITNDSMYSQVVQFAKDVIDGVKTLGVNKVTRLQVARILDSVLGQGATLESYAQEASKWQIVNHPGQIWGATNTILWWGFHRNSGGGSIRTWTNAERSWLSERGVHLTQEQSSRRREAAAWQRAAKMAKGRLLLFAPAKVKGQETPIHPLWDEIRYAVAREDWIQNALTIHADELRKPPAPHAEAGFKRKKEELRLLPGPQRLWQLPAHSVQPRNVESATSFEILLGCPLSWTFQYTANVRPGRILSLPHESIMLGTLGHEVLRKLITESSHWDAEAAKKRSGEIFDELVPFFAAPLLEPQNGILRNKTRFMLTESLKNFFEIINNAGIEITNTEFELEKRWSEGVKINGRLDLVGETSSGKQMLIDAKWSKHPRNYKQRLENLSVQLTLYHWLLAGNAEEELPVAYFMLRSGEFFTNQHDDIPAEYHILGPSLAESKGILQDLVDQVFSKLDIGIAVAPGIPIDSVDNEQVDSERPESDDNFETIVEPPCQFCIYQNLCGFRRVKV